MGWPKDKSGFVAYRFNPKTCEATRFDTFGPPNEHRRELYRKVMMFGDWIYAAIGARPWHLVAFNVQTGKGRVLATTEPIIGDPNTIAMDRMKDGLSGHIRNAASVSAIDEFDEDEFKFWVHDGGMYPFFRSYQKQNTSRNLTNGIYQESENPSNACSDVAHTDGGRNAGLQYGVRFGAIRPSCRPVLFSVQRAIYRTGFHLDNRSVIMNSLTTDGWKLTGGVFFERRSLSWYRPPKALHAPLRRTGTQCHQRPIARISA